MQDKQGNQYILKISPKQEHYKNELYFLKYFNNKIPVPNIIDAAEPNEILPGRFITVNTFGLEALEFYKKLDFYIEFERQGYNKDSTFYLFRKDLEAI